MYSITYNICLHIYSLKGDVYVHADCHGAGSTIIKNSNRDTPIP